VAARRVLESVQLLYTVCDLIGVAIVQHREVHGLQATQGLRQYSLCSSQHGRLHFTNIVAWLPSPLQFPRKQLLLGKTAHS